MIRGLHRLCVALSWLQLAIVLKAAHRIRQSAGDPEPVAESSDALENVIVIIPAHDAGSTITDTLIAWRNASPGPGEILVVDDGSTDDTAAQVVAIRSEMPRLRMVCQPHKGKAYAFNNGLRQSWQPIVVNCDADALPAAKTLSALVAPMLDSDSEVVATCGNRREFTTGPIAVLRCVEHAIGANLTRHLGNAWGYQVGLAGALSAFRRSALEHIGGLPVDALSEDTAATLKMNALGRQVYVPGADFQIHSPPISTSALEQHRRWLVGTTAALRAHMCRSDERRFTKGLAYFVAFRLLLPAIAWISDLYLLGRVRKRDCRAAVTTAASYAVPQALTGAVALVLDDAPRQWLASIPIVQVFVRQYTGALLVYTLRRRLSGTPIDWTRA